MKKEVSSCCLGKFVVSAHLPQKTIYTCLECGEDCKKLEANPLAIERGRIVKRKNDALIKSYCSKG